MGKTKQVSIGPRGVKGISKKTAKKVWAVLQPPLVEGVNAYRCGGCGKLLRQGQDHYCG